MKFVQIIFKIATSTGGSYHLSNLSALQITFGYFESWSVADESMWTIILLTNKFMLFL